MREPMEKMYGAETFALMWEAWVDGISHFANKSEGSEVTPFQIQDTNELLTDQTWKLRVHNLFFLLKTGSEGNT